MRPYWCYRSQCKQQFIHIFEFRFYKAIWIGIRLFSGNIDKSQHITYHKASKIHLERRSEAIIHIDGETRHPGKNLDITLINKGLNVIIP